MKAKDVLNTLRISRGTLHNYVKKGLIEVKEQHNGYYNYNKNDVYNLLNEGVERKTYIYGRVSTSKQKNYLENQINMLKTWCFNSGYKINGVYSDIASGISFEKRKSFFELLDEIINYRVQYVIIAHKDRLSRIGFEIFTYFFSHFGTEIIVVSEIGNKKLDSEEIFKEIIPLIN